MRANHHASAGAGVRPSAPASGATTWRQRLVLVTFGLVLALGLLEIGLRAGAWMFLTRLERRNRALVADRAFTILCIGESTTALGGDDAYPAQLERLLNAGDGSRVRVINKGMLAVDTDVILADVPAWLDTYHPDTVVAMMGVNDPPDAALISRPGRGLGHLLASLRVAKVAAFAWQSLQVRLGFAPTAHTRTSPMAGPVHPLDPDVAHAVALWHGGEHERALATLARAAERDPTTTVLQDQVALVYFGMFELDRARATLEPLVRAGRADAKTYQELEGTYYVLAERAVRDRRLDEAEALLGMAAALPGPHAEAVAESKRLLLDQARGDERAVAEHRARLRSFEETEGQAMTVANYQRLRALLGARGIPLVAVQYPLRDIEHLRAMLDGDPSVVYVDNDGVFREALRREPWEAFFVDAFGGDFGHMTPRGSALLAADVARAVREAFFDRRR